MSEIDKMMSQSQDMSELDSEVEKELSDALGEQSVEQFMDSASGASADEAAPAQGEGEAQAEGEAAAAQPTEAAQPEAKAEAKQADDDDGHIEMKRGRIVSIRQEDVFVDLIGLDSRLQGVVPLKQFDRPPRPGSIMDFVVNRVDEAEGLMHLAREGAVSHATWEQLHKGSAVEARVTGKNKGGLELEMVGRIRAFMPASQVDVGHIEDLEQFVGQKIQAVVTEIDRKGKRVTISRRRFIEQKKEREAKKTWATLEEGQTVKGTVRSLVQYGAFVDIGGVDGLLHITDMSYARVNKPSEIVKQGEEIEVQILKLERDKQKVRLGLKQTQADPWDAIRNSINVGDQVTGTVVRIQDFGAFVQVEQGVEALLPASEISWRRHAKVADEVKEGQQIRVAVIAVDFDKRRMTLSLKQSQGDPWVGAEHKFAADSVVEGVVKSTTEFGAFVELTPGVEGLVHISELAMGRVNEVEDVVKVGDTTKVRVLSIDEDERKISLSIRAVDNPNAGRDDSGGGRRGGRDRGPAKSTLSLPKGLLSKGGGKGPNLKGGIE